MALSTQTRSGLGAFDRTTSIWGPITLALGFVISLIAALYMAFGSGANISFSELATAVGAVLATFGIIAVIEPISYYPVLGKSAMYQAFLIGNIANKLLPSAMVAQANLNEKPGSRRAELIAGSAIIGAVGVHITTLIVLVGFLGTWLIGILPPHVIAVARGYILPAVFGAVLLQGILSIKNVRTTIIAFVFAALMVFVVVPNMPALAYYSTALVVVLTIVVAWFTRPKTAFSAAPTPID